MPIANCPGCGEAIEYEHMEDELARLAYTLGMLLVSAAMLRVTVEFPRYANAKEGFLERITELSSIAANDAEEIAGWGEHYDEDEASPPV